MPLGEDKTKLLTIILYKIIGWVNEIIIRKEKKINQVHTKSIVIEQLVLGYR